MRSGGAVVAMKVKGDRAALNRLVEALQIFVWPTRWVGWRA
jgi:cystathionine gamma-lyase